MNQLKAVILVLSLFITQATLCPAHPRHQQPLVANSAAYPEATVYQTSNLIIKKISPHVYRHISFLKTNDFGKVECNGMVVVNRGEAVVFDTPTDNPASAELIAYINHQLHGKIKAIIPTHFHDDCVGGITEFTKHHIPAYASNATIALLNSHIPGAAQGIKGFDKQLNLTAGGQPIEVRYFGQGHTRDNVVGYYPAERTLFGGCLIKELNATKGFLGDANPAAWPATVTALKQHYPKVKLIIPGHGQPGGIELLDYTIELFRGK